MFLQLSESLRLSYLALGDLKRSEPLIFLHGIMGNKKNLRGFVERFLTECPHYSAVIFDQRNHGLSSHAPPFTVDACARDLALLCEKLPCSPKKIIGHSFGGKVALLAARLLPTIEQVWLLDCSPGQVIEKKPLEKHHALSALDIVDILSHIEFPVASRRDLVDKLQASGVNNSVALWMTTNLIASAHGLNLAFVPEEIKEMLLDFIKLDLWSEVSLLSKTVEIHVVKAEHGQRLTSVDEEKLKNAAKNKGHFHVLKDAGHFLHVDNPTGLLGVMKPYF